MKRLCFLSPDLQHTRRVVDSLKADGIPERHIYVVARRGVELEDLPDAGPEADDFLAAYERGVAFGAAGGLLAGLTAMVFPPAGLVIGGGAVLLITLYGAGLGGFLTGLAGAAFPSSRLREFEAAIERGEILVMADVPQDRVEHYAAMIGQADPSVEVMGIEPPAPPLG
jgi:predicted lipid-binding transport protein (Tim44 family)